MKKKSAMMKKSEIYLHNFRVSVGPRSEAAEGYNFNTFKESMIEGETRTESHQTTWTSDLMCCYFLGSTFTVPPLVEGDDGMLNMN